MTTTVLATKRCTRCGEEKPAEAFSRNARNGDGRAHWCKACIAGARQRRFAALAAGQVDVAHGDPSTYANWGCRCDPCVEAHAAYLRRRRRNRTNAPHARPRPPRRPEHPGCGACVHDNGFCDRHQAPPVCICDEPDQRTDCDRCHQVHILGTCRRCHRPTGDTFAAVREAWREHLREDT